MAPRLADIHLTAQARIRDIVRRAVRAIWRSLGSYDEPDVPIFIEQVVPVVFAAQERSIALTDAYVARALDRTPLGIDPAPIAQSVRPVDSQTQWRRPFIQVWTDLQKGDGTVEAWQDAVSSAESRAETMADSDVQLAHKAAYAAIQEADPSILGFQRRLDSNACPFCQLVAGAYVKHATAMPLHPNCGCGLEPLTEIHPRAVFLPDGTRIREQQFGPLIDTPIPEGVAVEDHGEYGPVLVDPAHAFLSLDIAA